MTNIQRTTESKIVRQLTLINTSKNSVRKHFVALSRDNSPMGKAMKELLLDVHHNSYIIVANISAQKGLSELLDLDFVMYNNPREFGLTDYGKQVVELLLANQQKRK
ncbi:MAG: hypothetical protein ABR981_00810 [Candidatus Micrarchaeaceae archaeon]|jgi:nucleoside recognition membrane protein YjiH